MNTIATNTNESKSTHANAPTPMRPIVRGAMGANVELRSAADQAAEVQILRAEPISYGHEYEASLGALALQAIGIMDPGDDVAEQALRAFSEELAMAHFALEGQDENGSINESIWSNTLYRIHLRMKAAAELSKRFREAKQARESRRPAAAAE